MPRGVDLLPLGHHGSPVDHLPVLAGQLARLSGLAITVLPVWWPPSLGIEPTRFSSNDLVDSLIDRTAEQDSRPHPDRWTLGITNYDLFAPGREFVFGEATLGGHWAVISTARLMEGASEKTALERLLKESLHELGHLAGLGHCVTTGCVMTTAHWPADVDGKEAEFCPSCSSVFGGRIQG